MADSKITALTALTAADPVNDMFPVVDVSDTSMAASGTTKRISVNNILGASGTATLASATITGAATVGTTLGVTGVSTFAAGTALLPALTTTGDTNTGIYYPAADTFAVTTGGTERYRVDSSGNVGVGLAPSTIWATNRRVLQIGGTNSGAIALTGTSGSGELFFNSFFNSSSQNICVVTGGTGKYDFNVSTVGCHAWNIGTGTAGTAFTFTQAMTLDASGRLLVGSTSAFTDLTGSKEVKIGDGGLQTFSSAITAATATNIARSGFGALVHVAASNATGQYSAVVIFTSASATVVSVINGTGSTITFGVASGFLQITSSLALTNLVASGLRNN